MKLHPTQTQSESRDQPSVSSADDGAVEPSPYESIIQRCKRLVTFPKEVPVSFTRRDGLKLAGTVAASGGALASVGTATAEEQIIAEDAAAYSVDGQPVMLKVNKTDFNLSWNSLATGDVIITEFKVSPAYKSAAFETIGSTASSVDSTSGSVRITAGDLFPNGEGDVTRHSAIQLDDFGIDTSALSDPIDSDLVSHRTVDVRIESWLQSTGDPIATSETSFDVLYAVECGFGQNFGWLFGRKLPETYETVRDSLNV